MNCTLDCAQLATTDEGRISDERSSVEVWVVPTDESLIVAEETVKVLTAF